jgi:hypothetical protein
MSRRRGTTQSVRPVYEEDESLFVGLLQVEAAYRTCHDAGRRVAGCSAETDAPVGLGAEVSAVEAVAVEVDEPAARRALAFLLPEIEADAAHGSNIGAVGYAWLDLS